MFKNKAAGFTLMELLIGITLASLIFLGSSSLVIVLFTSSARASQRDEMEQAKNDIMQDLSNSIRWAEGVSFDSSSITVAVDPTDAFYQLQGERLFKNGTAITPETIAVTSMTINDYSASTSVVSLKIDIDFEHAQFSTFKDRMSIVVSQRNAKVAE